jgi:hypothetical protein
MTRTDARSRQPVQNGLTIYALREACDLAASALAAPIAQIIALAALAALGLSSEPFHETFHMSWQAALLDRNQA